MIVGIARLHLLIIGDPAAQVDDSIAPFVRRRR
jgi:hypothetical protein